MKRRYTTKEYLERVTYIKSKIEGLAVFCDIIAGYPTETEEDFEITKNFLRQIGFAGLHVFSYSVRPGTPAAALPQIPAQEIKHRSDELRALDKELRSAFAAKLVGTTQYFLAEEVLKDGSVSGVLANFARAHIENGKLSRLITPVSIIAAREDICLAREK